MGLWATWPSGSHPCAWQRGWTRQPLKVHSDPNYAMIIGFHDQRPDLHRCGCSKLLHNMQEMLSLLFCKPKPFLMTPLYFFFFLCTSRLQFWQTISEDSSIFLLSCNRQFKFSLPCFRSHFPIQVTLFIYTERIDLLFFLLWVTLRAAHSKVPQSTSKILSAASCSGGASFDFSVQS